MKIFQQWLAEWSHIVFGDMPEHMKPKNRCFKFVEEAMELAQAVGVSEEDAIKLVKYVYARPAGTPEGEIGQVICVLGTLANTLNIPDIEGLARAELRLCRTPAMIMKIRKKAKGMRPDSPLPGVG